MRGIALSIVLSGVIIGFNFSGGILTNKNKSMMGVLFIVDIILIALGL